MYILAIDQGTTGSRAFLFDKKGKKVSSAYQEFKQYYPQAGWVEHDAEEIWKSVSSVIRKTIQSSKIDPRQIQSIGITNQRETSVLWDRQTGKPVHKAIVWQCRRTAEICGELKSKGYEKTFRRKTGLVLDPYFSGTKVKWLLGQNKKLTARAKKGELAFGTIDSWLIWKLTGGVSHVTDMSNASRTLLFNIQTKKWDDELLKILSVPKNILPDVLPSGGDFGKTKRIAGLPVGIPIQAVLGDQQAALYGQECFKPGEMKNTYGTGCFLLLNTGQKLIRSKKGLLTTLGSDISGNPVYVLEGAVFIAGAAIQWIRDELKLIQSALEAEKEIRGVKDTNGVYLVPAFAGLGAPYWKSDARGIITGLTRGANRKHLIRAALESMAYQTKDVVDVMQNDLQKKIKRLKVDGGACQNDFLMQFQSDILGAKVVCPKEVDTTVKGVAMLAGLKSGLWTKSDFKAMNKIDRSFSPKMKLQVRKKLCQGWQDAIQKLL